MLLASGMSHILECSSLTNYGKQTTGHLNSAPRIDRCPHKHARKLKTFYLPLKVRMYEKNVISFHTSSPSKSNPLFNLFILKNGGKVNELVHDLLLIFHTYNLGLYHLHAFTYGLNVFFGLHAQRGDAGGARVGRGGRQGGGRGRRGGRQVARVARRRVAEEACNNKVFVHSLYYVYKLQHYTREVIEFKIVCSFLTVDKFIEKDVVK